MKRNRIFLLAGVSVFIAGTISVGLGLGLEQRIDKRVSFGLAAKSYFENEKQWNLSYIDDAENAKLVNLPNTKTRAFQSKNSNMMYQMLVYSFSDSNYDGIGDLWGAKNRLGYLDNLGVGSIWLSPIHVAPSYHSYDVMDYTSVSDEFGGMEAFDAFLADAHNRGIKVYLDMVFNHSSAKHPWFAKANNEPTSKYRDYYQFNRGPHKPSDVDYQGNENFYGSFWSGMPDLNLSNDAVIEELKAVIQFWVKKGVDGFRYDAYKHFFDAGEPKGDNSGAQIFAELKEASRLAAIEVGRIKEGEPNDIQFIGEGLGVSTAESNTYTNHEVGEEIRPALDGSYDSAFWTTRPVQISDKIASQINERAKSIRDEGAKSSSGRYVPWMPYLDNHDSKRWFQHVRSIVNPDSGAADYVTTNDDKSLLRSALLNLSMMPGRPIIYQGDELGYDATKSSDPYIREPFTWTGETPIQFHEYTVYGDFKVNTDRDPIELTRSKEVGRADVAARESNGIYQNTAAYLKVRGRYDWLEDNRNPLKSLSSITSDTTDGGIREKLNAAGEVEESILWFGTNIYNNYDESIQSMMYNLSSYVGSKSVEVLYKSSSSSFNPNNNQVNVARDGVIILRVK